jgi:glycosyltransferase involved in cell wall biosynthesis
MTNRSASNSIGLSDVSWAAANREQPSLSVIILMYNEVGSIRSTLTETLAFLDTYPAPRELIVVDDGSTDGSPDVVSSLCAQRPGVRMVSHNVNRGMGAAMKTGIEAASMHYLVFNAADGQIPAAGIAGMLPLLKDADIVITRFENGRENRLRQLLSSGLRWYLRWVAGIDGRLQGLYLFPTEEARRHAPRIDAETFLFSFALIQRGLDAGLKPALGWIRCMPRTAGTSKTLRLSTIGRVAWEGLRYRLQRKRADRYDAQR